MGRGRQGASRRGIKRWMLPGVKARGRVRGSRRLHALPALHRTFAAHCSELRLLCPMNPPLPLPPCHSVTAEGEEQISHLRGQLLRSEQDKELMRSKLEEERGEREKAQKQVKKAG